MLRPGVKMSMAVINSLFLEVHSPKQHQTNYHKLGPYLDTNKELMYV